jgi:uncharacterized protein YjbI with pentapeptide repeats
MLLCSARLAFINGRGIINLTREQIEEGIRRGDRTFLREQRLNGLDLSNLNFAEMDLQGVRLSGADLTRTNLQRANLRHAYLVRTKLIEADLSEADLSHALMHGARVSPFIGRDPALTVHGFKPTKLWRAKLIGTDLSSAWLSGADLREADLQGANLESTKMFSALIGGTDMCASNPELASLEDALYDLQTEWPGGFDPSAAGAILMQD